jgi:hypothetical protein
MAGAVGIDTEEILQDKNNTMQMRKKVPEFFAFTMLLVALLKT